MMLVKAMLLAAAPLLLAATQPQTLGPRVTGSMYNGNNAQPPKLHASQEPAGMTEVNGPSQSQDQTTSNKSAGRRSAEGGGG